MKDYAICYKKWIKHKHRSLRSKELKYQTKVYCELKKNVIYAHNKVEEATHDLQLRQKQLQGQAMLMREI